MDEWFSKFWQEIIDRPSGPLALRFYLQPTMAAFFALRDGLKDARMGRPAYFWHVVSDPSRRRELIRDGWKSVAKVFTLAVILDVVYQLVVLRAFHPLQTLVVATGLAIVPYVALRGPINRFVQALRSRRASDPR